MGERSRGGGLTVIIGGASSGKSLFAEELAKGTDRVTYIATARPLDEEMRRKIEAHQARRPAHWQTIEAKVPELAGLLARARTETVILDSLTLYAAEALNSADNGREHLLYVVEALSRAPGRVIVVTDEVGSGIVPESQEGRAFRQLLGEINQRLAAAADDVYFVAAGLPVALKGPDAAGRGRWV